MPMTSRGWITPGACAVIRFDMEHASAGEEIVHRCDLKRIETGHSPPEPD
jgi:hypothetical protein